MALRVSSMQLGKRSYSVLHFPSRSRKMTSSLQPSHQPSGRTSVVLSSVSSDSCLNPEAITTVRKQHVQPLWVGRGAGPGPTSSPAGSALFTADSGGQRGGPGRRPSLLGLGELLSGLWLRLHLGARLSSLQQDWPLVALRGTALPPGQGC